jgi:hypothetical protein
MTSKGRSPLEIALLHQKIDIVHYLVAEKRQSFFEEKTLNTNIALANFTSMLNMLPPNYFEGRSFQMISVPLNASFSTYGSGGRTIERRPSL